MIEKINDGGPALPMPEQQFAGGMDGCYGMTLRDYFAAKAIAALINTPSCWSELGLTPVNGLSDVENCAAFAYRYADAMLKARQS